jgi:hypothetical protein
MKKHILLDKAYEYEPIAENGSYNKKLTIKIEKLLKDEEKLVYMEGYCLFGFNITYERI